MAPAVKIARLYRRDGKRRVTWSYKHRDGRTERLAVARAGNVREVLEAELIAKRRAHEIEQGRVLAGSVADLIDRYMRDVAPSRKASSTVVENQREAANLKRFFGRMDPRAVRTTHCYQYLDLRARQGAPVKANREIALLSGVYRWGIRWGVVTDNPCKDIILNDEMPSNILVHKWEIDALATTARVMGGMYILFGLMARFAYVAGRRSGEVRLLHRSQLQPDGIHYIAGKRKRREAVTEGVIEWSSTLRSIIDEALAMPRKCQPLYVFGNKNGSPYTKSGFGTIWRRIQARYIREHGERGAQRFSLMDIRPAGITEKFNRQSDDRYDFAAHKDSRTTDRVYDRRRVRKSKPLS